MNNPTRYNVVSKGMQVGQVVFVNAWRPGWKFLPVFQANPSRKLWPTPEAAVANRVKGCTLEVA